MLWGTEAHHLLDLAFRAGNEYLESPWQRCCGQTRCYCLIC